MMEGLTEKLEWIQLSMGYLWPELTLTTGIILLLIASLFLKDGNKNNTADYLALIIFSSALLLTIFAYADSSKSVQLFSGMLQHDAYATYFKILLMLPEF